MREIKFKGKRIDNGGWMGGYFHRGMMSGYTYIDGTEVISDTVGQYTGLKDKNGKEIYEGDILECEFSSERFVVEFDAKTAQFTTKSSWLWSIVNRCEVISNIHDNPELKREPCEWCEGKVGKYFDVNWYDFTPSNTGVRPKAKFCPFCGRELDWEVE